MLRYWGLIDKKKGVVPGSPKVEISSLFSFALWLDPTLVISSFPFFFTVLANLLWIVLKNQT